MEVAEWARQQDYRVRFGWGAQGVEALGGDAIVLVDVLRFTTSVEAANSRDVFVHPYQWRDESVVEFAMSLGAQLGDGTDPLGPSLSPATLLRMSPGESVVLPSPNGSTCAALAAEAGATVVAACLRNAAAVAEWLRPRFASVSVIACGERWPDDSLRPALEDMIGAGAVVARLGGIASPDARAAAAVWLDAVERVEAVMFECASGRELQARDRGDDLRYAAQMDVSTIVPVLTQGVFRAHTSLAPPTR